MYRPTPSDRDDDEPNDRAARAFARVGWSPLVDKLYVYATCTLRLAAIRADRAAVVEALDLVHTLVEKALDGTLGWTLPDTATDEEIVALACAKLRGLLWTQRRRATCACYDDALDRVADDAPDALATLIEQSVITDVMRAFEHDAEAHPYLRGMIEGKKRAQIAAQLGLSLARANALQTRIMRGVAALRATLNDNGEDEPPSSGPRGHDDELPTAQERHRAPPEPPRRALRAAGRRR